MLGNNREIFFPKLEEEQMMTFDRIATALLKEHGYRVLECESDEEAIEKAQALKNGGMQYPVHYSCSDTSGEKAFEEFYTADESVDLNRLHSLGVVIDKPTPNKENIEILFQKLDTVLKKDEVTKEEIVTIIRNYLPSFEHLETGKSLDSKM